MSRSERREAARPAPPTGPDGAIPVALMTLSGVVKTSRGFAVCRAVLRPDGTVERIELLGPSQARKEFIAGQHIKVAQLEALKA